MMITVHDAHKQSHAHIKHSVVKTREAGEQNRDIPESREKGLKMSKEIPYKIYLEEQEMPKEWYNVRADMKKKPAPLLNPGTHQPMTLEELSGVFCEELASRSLTRPMRTSRSPRRSETSTRCTVLHPL